MTKDCFFCDILDKRKEEDNFILENEHFFARFDDFPVSKGHIEVISKKHKPSFFDLNEEELISFYSLVKEVKNLIQKKFNPDGFNLGFNEGKVAGMSQEHLHIHLISRYFGHVENPLGGVRNILG